MRNITRAGVDIAKSVFQVHAVDRHDEAMWQVKLKRSLSDPFFYAKQQFNCIAA